MQTDFQNTWMRLISRFRISGVFFANAFPFFSSTFFFLLSFLFCHFRKARKKNYSHGSLLFQICAQRQECVLSHIECRRGAAEKCKKLLHNVLRVHTLALSLCVYLFYRTTAAGRARCCWVFRFKLTHSHVQSHRIGDKWQRRRRRRRHHATN